VIFLKQQCIVLRFGMIHFQLSKILERIPFKIHLYLLILSIIITGFAAICTKFAAEIAPSTTFFGVNAILLIYLIILGAMGLQVIFWQQSLKHYSLSFAYPFRSLVSFFVLFSAYFFFGESIKLINIVGLAVISFGIFYLVKDKEFLN
jgi:drug/metabolite transporter (DMT)-like permease